MQVKVEVTEGLERRMTVEVPAERIDSEVEKRLQSLRGRTRIDGFRPGKAPAAVVKARFGRQVHQEVLGEVLQSSFFEAVREQQLRLAGGPRIEPQVMTPGKALEYTALFEVYPEVEPADPAKLKIVRPVAEIDEADVDKVIENLRRQRTTWNAVERAAQAGDQVTIDFVGRIDGEPFAGGSGKGHPLVLGSGSFIPGFEDKLIGAASGQTVEVAVSFPDDYHEAELAGKPAMFEVEVGQVAEPVLPEVDEEFVRAFNVAEGSVEALRRDVRENMERELAEALKGKLKQQVMDGLMAINQIPLPASLIDEEVERLSAQARQQVLRGQPAPEGFSLPRELFEEQARKRVSLGLLLAEIASRNGIKVDEARVRATIDAQAASYDQPDEVVKWYYASRDRLAGIESMVLEDQLVDWLLERAKVTEEKTSFDAVMNPPREGAK